MSAERERLVLDINNLKERVSLVWLDMISKPVTRAERQELRKSIESLLKELDTLRGETGSAADRRCIALLEP
jgi:hypothetical protein